MFMCFIDVFDCVDHEKLFYNLPSRGDPQYLIRNLAFWYANQAI